MTGGTTMVVSMKAVHTSAAAPGAVAWTTSGEGPAGAKAGSGSTVTFGVNLAASSRLR